MLAASAPPPMTISPLEYVTTDFYLAAFLCHREATLICLRRHGPKKVKFRFEPGEPLHALLRLYRGGILTPVVPGELFASYHDLKCWSIDKYE